MVYRLETRGDDVYAHRVDNELETVSTTIGLGKRVAFKVVPIRPIEITEGLSEIIEEDLY